MTILFDTLKFSRRLQAGGVPLAQANAFAEALSEATADDLATKTDIANLQAAIANVKSEIMKFMVLQTFTVIGAVIAIMHWMVR